MNKKIPLSVGAIAFLVLAFFIGLGGYFILYPKVQSLLKPTRNAITIERRSVKPGIVAEVVFAKSIDLQTSKPLVLSSTFVKTDEDIYMVLTLNNVSVGTRIEFVRYRNSKYVDHGSVEIVKPKAQYTNINWMAKPPLGKRPAGEYLIKVYTNGKLETASSYTVT